MPRRAVRNVLHDRVDADRSAQERKNREGLKDTLVDKWTYNDERTPSNRKKQPVNFETGTKKENLKPDGLWEVYAKNDAIFGVKPGDANIKGNPEEYLIGSAG